MSTKKKAATAATTAASKKKKLADARTFIAVQVGVSKETVQEARAAIVEILEVGSATRQDQDTIRLALTQFTAMCKVSDVTVTDTNLHLTCE